MTKRMWCLSVLLLFAVMIGPAFAEEQAGMPPMGQPEEMKELIKLVGTWECVMQSRWSDTSENWMESKGTATYELGLDGCVLKMKYVSTMMGMPFEGFMVQSFDRELKEWQTLWVDNMSARMSMYTGKPTTDGSEVVTGVDYYGGQKMHTRMTTYDYTETSFKWKMETSTDGGKTWWVSGKADYTKKG